MSVRVSAWNTMLMTPTSATVIRMNGSRTSQAMPSRTSRARFPAGRERNGDDHGAQPYPLGVRRGEPQCGVGLQHVLAGVVRIGLDQMIAHPHRVHARLLGGAHHLRQPGARLGRTARPGVIPDVDTESHAPEPSSHKRSARRPAGDPSPYFVRGSRARFICS